MIVLLLAFLGGVFTLFSPCILPVLPFVFARAGRSFARSTVPMLLGLAASFTVVATLAAVGGGWVVRANQYGRLAALVVLALFGVSLLSPRLAAWFARPLTRLGQRMLPAARPDSIPRAFGLGAGIGLVWAPCAGPILGIVLTTAALRGANVTTTLLLLTYALGAGAALAIALLAGGQLAVLLRRLPGMGEMLRRLAGVAVLAGVVAIASGLDTGVLTRWSLPSTTHAEQALMDHLQPIPAARAAPASGALDDEGGMPSLAGATGWINTAPLTRAALRGKVVLVDFWTYSCINCLRALPYVKAWAAKYRDHGLVVIGVHSPEFAFEKDPANVAAAVKRLGIAFPVAIDSNYAIWQGFDNQYWPADYFIDAHGRIRHHTYGEGGYREGEDAIRTLLAQAGQTSLPTGYVDPNARGAEAPDSGDPARSPETYVGYARSAHFASGQIAHDEAFDYRTPARLAANQWGLAGRWTLHAQAAVLDAPGGSITYRFRGRDLHLVLGPGSDGKPVRFHISLDGAPPGADHGMDTDAQGNGTVTTQRLYQLVRQAGDATHPRTFTITFDDPGVHAYAFTFG
ncbi:MAG: redoxin domain-containing protein [Rhodanobacter sp.]|nr:MAG: redoxin domain-containing protein [Rhodanobacter sp.]TAM13458.1 MAG: redoxin domain-containing protein [Rhodanobacter sp.]TAM35789.1 MAG: redoxin domain-containing protein [Rhodanobacter sp.]